MTIDVAPEVEVSGDARLAHDGWVSEFEAFQWSDKSNRNNNGGGLNHVAPTSARSARSGRSVGARSKMGGPGDPNQGLDNLRAEIKLLHWHKLANEAALKAALLKTKKIKAQGGRTTRPVPAMTTLAMPTGERAAWMQQVIEEEQSKPLRVSKDFMSKYEEQEMENEGRLDSEVAAHIRSLRNLRKKIEKRGDMKEKRTRYRAAQKQLEMEKQQLLLGKLSTGDEDPALAPTEPRPLQGVTATTGNGQPAAGKGAPKTVGALDTVLGSLDKLVELEKRITSLEKSNVYDNFRATKHGSTESIIQLPSQPVRKRKDVGINSTHRRRQPAEGQKNRRLSFSKQKTEATVEGPSQVYYSVRVRRRAGSTARESAGQRKRTGGAAKNSARTGNAVAAGPPSARTRAGASSFLTQLPDVHRHTKAGMECPRGGEGFRSAIATKKRLEAKRRMAGDRAEAVRIARQDRIIREWMQSKKAAAATGARQRKSSVLPAAAGRARPRADGGGGGGGTASSRAAPNAHLQEFRDIRAQYAKRTEKLRRDLSRRQRGPERAAFLTGTRTVAVARPKPVPAASVAAPSRPARLSRPRPGLARSRGVRRHGDVTEANNRGGGGRRVGSGAGLAVGGTGLRAARARRQVDTDLGVDTRRMRGDGSRTRRAVPVLPRVGEGRRPVGGGMSSVRARRW